MRDSFVWSDRDCRWAPVCRLGGRGLIEEQAVNVRKRSLMLSNGDGSR